MMASTDRLVPVAKILKSYGTDGALLLRFYVTYREIIELERPVFIKFDRLSVPFFISKFESLRDSQAVVTLRGIYNSSLSEEVKGKRVYIDYIEREKESTESEVFKAMVGYSVFSDKEEYLGSILSFHNFPGNPCFSIGDDEEDQEQFLLPIHPDLIIYVDPEKEEIEVILPDGLQDVQI